MVNFALSTGYTSIYHTRSGYPVNLRPRDRFGFKKLETSSYREVQNDNLNRLGVAHKCDRRTDGQIDRTDVGNSAVYTDARTKMLTAVIIAYKSVILVYVHL